MAAARRPNKESYEPSRTNDAVDDDGAGSDGDHDDVSPLDDAESTATTGSECSVRSDRRSAACACSGRCPCNRQPNPVPDAGDSVPIKLLRQFSDISAAVGQKFATQSVELPKLLMYSGITLGVIVLLISVVPIRMLTALLYGLLIVVFLTYLVLALYQPGATAARRKRPNPESAAQPQPIQKHKLKAWRESVSKLR